MKKSTSPLYLDHAASTPMIRKALDVLLLASEKGYANPAAQHSLGQKLNKKINQCRIELLKALGSPFSVCNNYQVIFTSSATEANNMIIRGYNFSSSFAEVVYSQADHPSVVNPVASLITDKILNADSVVNYNITTKNIDNLYSEIEKKINTKTEMIILTHINNSSGHIIAISQLARKIKEHNKNIHIHIDASQSFGKMPFDFEDNSNNAESSIDSVTLSAHKMGGPKGISALISKRGLALKPLFYGGGHEEGLRSSTPALPLILSWVAAIEDVLPKVNHNYSKLTELNLSLRKKIKNKIPDCTFLFSEKNTSPYILSMILPEVFSDVLLRVLDQKGFIASSSSSCSSKNKGPSPVFTALGIEEKYHRNILRISFNKDAEVKQLDDFVEELSLTYQDLKSI